MKKVLVIATSFRKGGNSDTLADEFIRGAADSGNAVEKICLHGKRIGFCTGCLACRFTRECVIRDAANEIVEKMRGADAIVFATPIYFYGMSGQMKTLLDRSNPLFLSEYNFRDIYLLMTSTDGEPAAMDGAITGLQGWIQCFEKAKLCGTILGFGFEDIGEIYSDPDLLQEAYDLGKAV